MKKHILFIASGICSLIASSQAELIAWYKFDEGAGATIAANQLPGSTGAIGSNVTTGVTGIAGNAYSFTGADGIENIVEMGNASFFPLIVATGQLTFSAWVNTTDTTDDRNTVIYAGSNTINNSYTDMGVDGLNGFASARNRPQGSVSPQGSGILSDPYVVNDGNWHNIVMTVDLASSVLYLYVDGVWANGASMSKSLFPDFNSFEVGRLGRAVNPSIGYLGLIDDVQVYNTALTDEQVQFLYNNPGSAIPEPKTTVLAGLGVLFLLLGYFKRAGKAVLN